MTEARTPDQEARLKLALEVAAKFNLYVPEPVTASWLDRKEWLMQRVTGVGSSEVWKLASEDPDDRTSLYLDKICEDPLAGEDVELVADLERGRLFEPTAAMKYMEQTGRELIDLPLLRHPEDFLLLTDVDRLILPGTGQGDYLTPVVGVWEGKVPRWHVMSRYRRHGLPKRIIWQVQHHLAITGFEFCSITVFNADSLSLLEWDIQRDEDMIRFIREEVPRFWAEHVEPRIPPETDEVPVNGVVVPEVEGVVKSLEENETWLEAAALFREADPLYKEAEGLRKEAVAKLRAIIGSKAGEYEGGGVRGVLSTTPGRVKAGDTLDRIADAWPLDSEQLKKLLKGGELRNDKGKKLSEGDVNELVNRLKLDVYGMKVTGDPGLRFVPRILREE